MKHQFLCFLKVFLALIALTPLKAMAIDDKWGEATISVGEEKYLATDAIYDNIDKLSTNRFVSCSWSSESSSVHIISSDRHGCWIEGVRECTNVKVTCKFTYETDWGYAWIATTVNGYYLVTAKNNGPICVSSITLNASSITLNLNSNVNTKQLSVESILPANATNKTVSWFSSNESVATVSSNGLVTAKSEGSATITCKANDECGVYTTCAVKVTDFVDNISLNWRYVGLGFGKTMQLIATVSPSNAKNKTLKWTSSDTNVVKVRTVNENTCEITGCNSGNTIVTCSAQDGSGVTATCEVIVTPYSGDRFTAETIEGVEMTFEVRYNEDCWVIRIYPNASIDRATTGKITIPSEVKGLKVTRIEYEAFKGCAGITSVSIPSSVTSIGQYVFQDCEHLESVNIPSNVTDIGSYTFSGCKSLKSVTIPSSVTSIESNTFENCSSLSSVTIPKNVTSIGYNVFSGCINLASISIAQGNPKYDSRNNCNAIVETTNNTVIVGCKNSTFPSTVKAIGSNAFNGMGLTEVVIPDNIESIASSAFTNNDITTVFIGKGVKAMGNGDNPFKYNENLSNITVASENPYFDSRDNCNAIIEKSTDKLITGIASTVIPASVKCIGKNAFAKIHNIDITLPSSVERIEENAFWYNTMKSVAIGMNVKEIGEKAFTYCYDLQNIYCFAKEPITIPESVFYNRWDDNPDATYNNATLHVPNGSKNKYKTTAGWSKFKNIVEFDTSRIDAVAIEEHESTDVFSLSGQKLAAPKKGINIVGGRKVAVK